MTMDLAHSYAQIIKQEKQEDGTLLVYGKATDDALDIDQQICDAGWLDRAMPEWFKTGGNIREQHSNIAAGVAKELDSKEDGHYISALVVDPVSIKKVEAGVLKGFSIGIRSPRIVRDTKAANGRIIDGQIVEISLVDRPANPNAKLMLAKCDNELDLIKVEEYAETENIEKHGDHDQSDHNPNSGGGGSDSKDPDSAERDRMEATRDNSIALNTETQVSQLSDKANNLRTELEDDDDTDGAEAADRAIETLNSAAGALNNAGNMDTMSGHTGEMEDALRDLEVAQDILNEIDSDDAGDLADEVGEAIVEVETYLDELYGRGQEKSLTAKTTRQKERAMARKSRAEKSAEAKEADGMPMNGEAKAVPSREEMLERYSTARKALDEVTSMAKGYGYDDIDKQYGESAEAETAEGSKPEAAEEEVEEAEGKKPLDKSDTSKCLECGCDKPSDAHGRDDVTTAEMVAPTDTPKSLETVVPLTDVDTNEDTETITEEDSSDDEDLSNKTITAIIEKAVKSARDAVTDEINTYKEEVNKLQSELATAKTKAVAGGPKRSVIKPAVIAELGDLLQKAAEYRAKSAVTDDKDLARGYKELASDFEAKALLIQASK